MADFKLTFAAEIKEPMESYLRNQQAQIGLAGQKWFNKQTINLYEKALGTRFFILYNYKFLSDTEAVVSINAPIALDPNIICLGIQRQFIKGTVKVEHLKEAVV